MRREGKDLEDALAAGQDYSGWGVRGAVNFQLPTSNSHGCWEIESW